VVISQNAGCFCGERPLCATTRAGPDISLRVGAVQPSISCEACNGLTIDCPLPNVAPGRVALRINEQVLAGDLTIAAAPPGTARTEHCRPIPAPTLETPWHAAQLTSAAWALCRDSDDGSQRDHECLVAGASCREGIIRPGSVVSLCMPDTLRCARIERDLARISAALTPAPTAASVNDVCPASSGGRDARTLRTLRRGDVTGYACNDSTAAGDLARLHREITEMCTGD
jgi:hypothetical protein